MVDKINPIYDPATPRAFLGKSLSEYVVTLAVDVTGSTAPFGAIDALIKAAELRATVVMISAISATEMTIFVEGEFPEDDYNHDGTPVTFEEVLEADFAALGTVDSLDLSGTTVAAGVVYKADQV